MTTPQQGPRPPEFDGLVVEDASGVRLLAIPASILPVLRSAAVLRFRAGDAVFNMSLRQFPTARTEQPATLPVHGAQNPSPAPPPAPEQDPEDPANIPLRVRRGGEWTTVHVTREQYERYEREGKLTHQPPADYEGNDQ